MMIAPSPPPIPGCSMAASPGSAEHTLLWVHTGHARITADDTVHDVGAGSGIWLPAESTYRVRTDPATIAFPIPVAPGAIPGAPTVMARFEVDARSRDWLVAQSVAPFTTYDQVSPAELGDLIGPSRPRRPRAIARSQPANDHLPMPQRAPARRVASALIATPRLDHTLQQWARLVASSTTAVS